jgi:hypothetical protein
VNGASKKVSSAWLPMVWRKVRRSLIGVSPAFVVEMRAASTAAEKARGDSSASKRAAARATRPVRANSRTP